MSDYFRGYEINMVNGQWVFCDTKLPTIDTWKERPCGYCGSFNTPEGHDGCIGTLPGVMNACCGHGQQESAEVQFLDSFSIHGKDAVDILNILKKYNKCQNLKNYTHWK